MIGYCEEATIEFGLSTTLSIGQNGVDGVLEDNNKNKIIVTEEYPKHLYSETLFSNWGEFAKHETNWKQLKAIKIWSVALFDEEECKTISTFRFPITSFNIIEQIDGLVFKVRVGKRFYFLKFLNLFGSVSFNP